jgi:hypothetical protein
MPRPIPAMRRAPRWLYAVLTALLVAACGIRQAVYVPQGFQELAVDGSFVQEDAGMVIHMPVLVVNKSDVTLHPAITIDPRGHEVRLVAASWRVEGKDVAPLTAPDPATPVDTREPLDLHWNVSALGPAVNALGTASWIQLELRIDGAPHPLRIDLARKDHF